MIIDNDSTRENCQLTAGLVSSRGACQLLASDGKAREGGAPPPNHIAEWVHDSFHRSFLVLEKSTGNGF